MKCSLGNFNFLEEISSLSHSDVFLYFLGRQETPVVTGKFVLGIRNEAGQRLIEFCQENTLVIANTPFQQHMRQHGHHQLANTEIRWILLFAN